jgi:hypothetical protein
MTETAPQDDGRRIRVWKNIGPQASIESIEEVLTWLRSVQDAAKATDDEAGGYFTRTGPEADRTVKALWIDRLTFENPLEVWDRGPALPARLQHHHRHS